MQKIKKSIDLGCGTGILSFLLCKYGLGKVDAIDVNEKCIDATKINSQSLGYNEYIKEIEFDLTKDYFDYNSKEKKRVNKDNDKDYNLVVKEKQG